MNFSFFFLWLPILTLKLQYAGAHILVNHNNFEKAGQLHSSDQHKNTDEHFKTTVHEKGDWSSLFVKKFGVMTGNLTRCFDAEFPKIQALIEQEKSTEGILERQRHSEQIKFSGIFKKNAECPNPDLILIAAVNETCAPMTDAPEFPSHPSLKLGFLRNASFVRHFDSLENRAMGPKNVNRGLLKQAAQLDYPESPSGPRRKQSWKKSDRKNSNRSYLPSFVEKSKERYVYLSKEVEVGAESSDPEADDDDEEDEPWETVKHDLPTHEDIVGGEGINIREAPFMVQIMAKSGLRVNLKKLRNKRVKFINYCAGTLITSQWVLTAAHCIAYLYTGKAYEIWVFAGITHTGGNAKFGDKPQVRVAARFIQHPDFQVNYTTPALPAPTVHDIGLIKVWKPFFLDGTYVRSIRIRGRPWFETVRKKNCTVAGWGAREFVMEGSPIIPFPLQRMNVVALHGYTTCPCRPREEKQFFVCMERGQTSICSGDSGASLICDGELVAVAAGILSTPFLCSERFAPTSRNLVETACISDFFLPVYAYTCPYLDWLRSHVGASVPPKPESCSAVQLSLRHALLITLVTLAVMV